MLRVVEVTEALKLCQEAACAVGDPGEMTSGDIVHLSGLVMATVYHESGGLVYNYQRAKTGLMRHPALGIAQIEAGTLDWLLGVLRSNRSLADRFDHFMFSRSPYDLNWLESIPSPVLHHILQGWPRLNIGLVTVLYLKRVKEIPATLRGAAETWKEHYNTRLGKGTVDAFLATIQPIRTLLPLEGK